MGSGIDSLPYHIFVYSGCIRGTFNEYFWYIYVFSLEYMILYLCDAVYYRNVKVFSDNFGPKT